MKVKNLLDETLAKDDEKDKQIIISGKPKDFVNYISKHRIWDRRAIASKVSVL